jgi:hypothetical protein
MNPEVESLNLFSIIQAAGWPIGPLIASSIFAPTIILERLHALQTTSFCLSKPCNTPSTVPKRVFQE